MKLKILILILWLFIYSDAFSACSYQSKLDQCTAAQIGQKQREITDFVCISGSAETRAYQIILDERFQEIDEQIETYISDLEKNKSYYFWKDKQKNYIEGVENMIHIFQKDGEYGKMYYDVCSGLQEEVIGCIPPSTQINEAKDYYGWSSTVCTRLAKHKLEIYKVLSYDLLLLNKLQVSKDEKKMYVQEERMKYDNLLTKFMVNIGYVERIWAKWPSKIKNTSWS